jgi:hypothetical protein
MRLVPERRHDLLCAFFCKARIRAGLHKKRLHPWGKVVKQFDKGLLVLFRPDPFYVSDPSCPCVGISMCHRLLLRQGKPSSLPHRFLSATG